VRQIAQIVADPSQPLGALEQVIMERTLADRSRARVLRQASEDAEIVKRIFGNIQTVIASGVDTTSDSWGGMVLNVTCELGLPIRWTLAPVDLDCGFRVTIIGAKGRLVWQGDEHGIDTRLDGSGSLHVAEEWVAWNWSQVVLSKFAETLRGQTPDPAWTSVCQCMEVVDATERSIARGRRIDLTGKTVTEKDTFRSVMSAGGCFLILIAILVLIAFAVVEGFRMASLGPMPTGPNASGSDSLPAESIRPTPYWAILLAIPMVGFLILQFLQMVIRRPRNDDASDG
jgi:hypothetical protein